MPMTGAEILKNCIELNLFKYLASHLLRIRSEYKIMVAKRGLEALFPFVKEELEKMEQRGVKISVDEKILYAVEYYMSNNHFNKPMAANFFAPIPRALEFIDVVREKMIYLGWEETKDGSLGAPPNVVINR
ncbi:MAG: hypothetical protein LBI42_02730 [Chitinispirillales bacterium]|nr:hypothetical protein [Chitinispirillales bacterium]